MSDNVPDLRAFIGGTAYKQPSTVLSEHTMDDFYSSLINRTPVTVRGYGTPGVVVGETEPTETGFRAQATVGTREKEYTFVVDSISSDPTYTGTNFKIVGSMRHQEAGNYYRTHNWTTHHALLYREKSDSFEFVVGND